MIETVQNTPRRATPAPKSSRRLHPCGRASQNEKPGSKPRPAMNPRPPESPSCRKCLERARFRAVRYEYHHDGSGRWYRAQGNENWGFDELGCMKQRYASIRDQLLKEGERKFRWELKS